MGGGLLLFFLAYCFLHLFVLFMPLFISNFVSSRTILPPSLWKSCYYRLLVLFCFVCFLDDIFFLWIRYYAMTSGSFSNGDVFVVG